MAYDGQGNLASKNGTGYTFDYGNRLRSTAGQSYRYDADGRHVRQDSAGTSLKYSYYAKDGRLLWQRDEPASKRINNVYLAGSLLAEITRPIGNTTATISYFHTDALGSPIAKTNAAGAIIETSEYEPYGRLLNRNNDDRAGYTGHVMDAASGLTYMQQRYYDPAIGAFLSVDPVTAYSNPVGAFNRYRYANNNPYMFTDPDGRRGKFQYLHVVGQRLPQVEFERQMNYVISNTEGAQEAIDYILDQDIDVTIAASPSREWAAVRDESEKYFMVLADPERTIQYRRGGAVYVLPIFLALKHELNHGVKFAKRGGKNNRKNDKRANDMEEEDVTNQEEGEAKGYDQPGRRNHNDGTYIDIPLPLCQGCYK